MNQRRERQSSVGRTARDDDLRALTQRFNHRRRTEINARTLNRIAHSRARFAVVHVAQLDPARQQFVDTRHDVVARYDSDAHFTRESELTRDFDDRVSTATNIHAARVRRNLDVAFDAHRQNALHQWNEVARVTRVWIPCFLFLHDRHRDFRQIVEHEVIDWSTFNLTHGRVGKISPETLACCYANFFFHPCYLCPV